MELIVFKPDRRRKTKPIIKMDKRGLINLNNAAAKKIGLGVGDKVQFAFNERKEMRTTKKDWYIKKSEEEGEEGEEGLIVRKLSATNNNLGFGCVSLRNEIFPESIVNEKCLVGSEIKDGWFALITNYQNK